MVWREYHNDQLISKGRQLNLCTVCVLCRQANYTYFSKLGAFDKALGYLDEHSSIPQNPIQEEDSEKESKKPKGWDFYRTGDFFLLVLIIT